MRMALTSPVSHPDGRAGHGQDAHPARHPHARARQAAAPPARRPDGPRRQADAGGDRAAGGDAPPHPGAAPGGQGGAWPGPPARRRPRRGRRGEHARRPAGQPARQGGRARRATCCSSATPTSCRASGRAMCSPTCSRSGRFPVTRLTQIFRQGAGSGIATNAARINAGQLPRFGGDVADCFFLAAEDPAAAGTAVDDWSPAACPRATASRRGRSRCCRRCTGAMRGWGR